MANYESRRVGDHEFSFVSFPMQVQIVEYAFSDFDASYELKIPVESGLAVLGVAHEVTTAFSGGTPSIDVGDGSTTDFWLGTADITETVTGNFSNSLSAGVGGAKFNSAGNVVLTSSTELAAGAGAVYIFSIDQRTNWRTAGNIP